MNQLKKKNKNLHSLSAGTEEYDPTCHTQIKKKKKHSLNSVQGNVK